MSDVFEKLVRAHVNGPLHPEIPLDQVPEIAEEINQILADNDIFISYVKSTERFYNIYLENGKEEMFGLPGKYDGDVTDILDFCDALSDMKEAFPQGSDVAKEILDMMDRVEKRNIDAQEVSAADLLIECQMITRAGKIVKLHEDPGNDDWYETYDIYLRDDKDKLYKKDLWSPNVYLCTPEGEPSHMVGKIDVRDLWEQFGDVPMNPETERLEEPWAKFPANTFREDIWHWFEKEFSVSVADLMHDMEKVDKQLLSFDKDTFNLKENRSFTRKKLEQTQAQGR